MKIALASAEFIDRDIAFNLSQVRRYMKEAKRKGAELVCFGESFLQGFDSLCWDFETDKNVAVSLNSPEITRLCQWTAEMGIDLLLGFIEREGDILYSTCALLGGGKLLHRYRRISKGWKEYWRTDGHYCEGEAAACFSYGGKRCLIGVCGDLWDFPERFRQEADVLFWPVYVDFTVEEWERNELADYAKQAALACSNTLLINSVTKGSEPAYGGCYHFAGGAVKEALPMGKEGLLILEV